MRRWSGADLGALMAVVDAALPGEDVSADELRSAVFDDPVASLVLADDDGLGAVAVAVTAPLPPTVATAPAPRTVATPPASLTAAPPALRTAAPPALRTAAAPARRTSSAGAAPATATIVLIAVPPGAQGQGRGRRLLAAAEEWAFGTMGAAAMAVGAALPDALWPGLDAHWTQALGLFESAGYAVTGATVAMALPTAAIVPARSLGAMGAPAAVRRVLEDADAHLALDLARTAPHPGMVSAVARGIEQGTCLLAISPTDQVLGLACHSLARAGWLGPLLVVPAARRRGVGTVLLDQLLTDLRVAGHRQAVVAPATPAAFFVRAGRATTWRVYLHLAKDRPAGP